MAASKNKRANKLIRKNDVVMVITGKNKGKSGKILKINPEKNTVIIEKVNFIKKHQRPSSQVKQGGIIEREGPVRLDNIMLIDPSTNKPSKVRIETQSDGKKVRVFKTSGQPVDVKK